MLDEGEGCDLVGRIRKGGREMVTIALGRELICEYALRQQENSVVRERARLTEILA